MKASWWREEISIGALGTHVNWMSNKSVKFVSYFLSPTDIQQVVRTKTDGHRKQILFPHFVKNYNSTCFKPNENKSIDESTVKFKVRVDFRQIWKIRIVTDFENFAISWGHSLSSDNETKFKVNQFN